MLSEHADARAYLFDFVHANGGKPSGYSYATLRVDSFPSITQWFVYIYTGLVCASWYQTGWDLFDIEGILGHKSLIILLGWDFVFVSCLGACVNLLTSPSHTLGCTRPYTGMEAREC